MARFGDCDPATLGLEDRGSRFVSSRLSPSADQRPSAPRDEEMTPLGVRSLSRPAVTAERHARVATLGRVFHQGRSSFWTRRGPSTPRAAGRPARDTHTGQKAFPGDDLTDTIAAVVRGEPRPAASLTTLYTSIQRRVIGPLACVLVQDDAVRDRATCTTRCGKGISMSAWASAL